MENESLSKSEIMKAADEESNTHLQDGIVFEVFLNMTIKGLKD